MVRGPSPLLTAGLAGVAALVTLVAPALPSVGDGPGVRVAAVLAAVLIGALVLSAAWLQGGSLTLFTLLCGAALLALAFDAATARAAASVPEALMWSIVGMLFARRFDQAALAVGVGVLVAGLALAGVAGGGISLTALAGEGDPLTLELPAFGGGQALAVGALIAVVLGAVGTWTPALGLRGPWTVILVLEALALAVALRIDPVAPVLAVFLLVNADRLIAAVRADDADVRDRRTPRERWAPRERRQRAVADTDSEIAAAWDPEGDIRHGRVGRTARGARNRTARAGRGAGRRAAGAGRAIRTGPSRAVRRVRRG